MNPLKSVWAALIAALGASIVSPAIAQPSLEFDSQTPSFERTLSLGDIRVVVDHRASENLFESDLYYILYYQGDAKLQEHRTQFMSGDIWLQDLNRDNTAEAIVSTYSGGAHCCTTHRVYQWDGRTFSLTTLGPSDGNGGAFKDLDSDGIYEFTTFDGAFLYAFSPYARSFPPSRIFRVGANGLEDVTRNYPEYLRDTAWRMYQAIQQGGEINGVLAGYVAQKILLGEFEEGWQLMLTRYDRTSDWGLDIRNSNGDIIGQHPDFPTALRAFLVAQGYL